MKSNQEYAAEFKALPKERKEAYFTMAHMIGSPNPSPIYQGSAIHDLYLLKEHHYDMLKLAQNKPEVYQAYHPFPLPPEHHDYESFYEPWLKGAIRAHQIVIAQLEEEIKKRLYFFGKGKTVDSNTITAAKVSAGIDGIIEVLDEAGIQVFTEKRQVTFRCNHGPDTTPSGTISVDKNGIPRWKCYGCGREGDILDALKEFKGYNFMDSLRWLSKHVGISLIK